MVLTVRSPNPVVLVVLGVLASACGGSGAPTAPTPPPQPPTSTDTLRAAAGANGRRIGAAVQSGLLNEARYSATVAREFNSLPETAQGVEGGARRGRPRPVVSGLPLRGGEKRPLRRVLTLPVAAGVIRTTAGIG